MKVAGEVALKLVGVVKTELVRWVVLVNNWELLTYGFCWLVEEALKLVLARVVGL